MQSLHTQENNTDSPLMKGVEEGKNFPSALVKNHNLSNDALTPSTFKAQQSILTQNRPAIVHSSIDSHS